MQELWRHRGTPHYLKPQAQRLGITPVLADRARNNPEIYRVSVLLAQLSERYHKARRENDRPVLSPPELGQVRGTLQQAEQECAKLHALAAAAAEMIDDAYSAFFGSTGPRHYAVLSDYDVSPATSLGDGTVGATNGAAHSYTSG
jgi:hypothetical protein